MNVITLLLIALAVAATAAAAGLALTPAGQRRAFVALHAGAGLQLGLVLSATAATIATAAALL